MKETTAIQKFIARLHHQPSMVSFDETMQLINTHFDFTPTAFDNGPLHNEQGTNEGSCRIFALAQKLQLSNEQTLACFGDYYRVDVLQHPKGDDHGNIRQFMRTGLSGIHFDHNPLQEKD